MTYKEVALDLNNLQQQFISTSLKNQPASNELLSCIDDGKFTAESLLNVYRHSVQGNLTQALSLTYPVIETLLGQEFFRALTIRFIELYPPTCSNMDDYGCELPQFLADFEHTKSYLYLPDVAALEWNFHLSAIADDSQISAQELLNHFTAEQLAQLPMVMAPSAKLMIVQYPVDQIWLANQPESLAEELEQNSIEIGEPEVVYLLLLRQQMKVTIYRITELEYQLLNLVSNEHNLLNVLTKLTEQVPAESLAPVVQKHFQLGTIYPLN